MRWLRLIANLLVAMLPSTLKVPIYRLFYGYTIGPRVRIGFGVLFHQVGKCRIGRGTRIGAFNAFVQIRELAIGEASQIGFLNLFRGGDLIDIGSYTTILRGNIFNSILNPDVDNPLSPVLRLGIGTVVTTGHWLDFTDHISLGAQVIVGGRNSSFWTHSRQRTRAITIGDFCYLGSEVRAAPGVEVPSLCLIAIGSVLMGRFDASRSMIAGNPATVVRELTDRDLRLVVRKTRSDLPDELASALLPEDLRDAWKPPDPEIPAPALIAAP